MNEIYAYTYLGWFLLGMSMSIGPCMIHQGFILVPFIGMTRKSIGQAVKEFCSFHIVRLITHAGLGTLGGAVGYQLQNVIAHRSFALFFRSLLGIFLMGLAIFVLFHGKNVLCRWTHKHFIHKQGKAMFLAGFLTALTPCPALLGLLAYTAASQRILYGTLAGLAFAAGTIFSPLFLAVPLWGAIKKYVTSPKIQNIFILINALIFFAFGFHLLLSVIT